MKKDKNCGYIVDLCPAIYTDAQLFIPKLFDWEKESERAEVVMGDYSIKCNLGTKLLFKTDKGIVEMTLPFKKSSKVNKINLIEYLNNNNIPYKIGDGINCDGIEYNQNDATREVIYGKDAIIEIIISPHWGIQMELNFVNKKLRPTIKGKKITIIRFNNCRKEKQYEIEKWFSSIINGDVKIKPSTLEQVMRENLERIDFMSCSFFYEEKHEYKWGRYF